LSHRTVLRENAPRESLADAPRLIEPDSIGLSKGTLLQGQVAVVTGAGRGIGRAIGEALAEAGAAVVVVSRSPRELEEVADSIAAAGGTAISVVADVTDPAAVEELLAQTSDRFGSPTLLVNNAGTWHHVGPLEDADPEVWWRDVEVSLKGAFLCTRAVLPAMRDRGEGRIVNVSSYAAVAARPYATAYACAKAAVLRLTDSLHAELAGSGVFAFAVTPGFVATALVNEVAYSEAGRRFLPELGERTDSIDPGEAGRLVVQVASGKLDALAGRFLHVLDNVDELLRHMDEIAAQDLYALRMRRLAAGG
jgi:NAD(P)-dependent dehydrogenase (short-subunit alcohol dehydrogenase family)